jgi:hypothetical protein
MWRDVYGLSTALTEDDETCVEPIGCGLGQEIFLSPNFLLRTLAHQFRQCDRRRAATAASDELSKGAVKVTGNLVQ